MGNITLFIPDHVLKKMKETKEIRWSEVARQAIEKRIREINMEQEILQKSKITAKDISEIAKKIKKEAAQEFDKM